MKKQALFLTMILLFCAVTGFAGCSSENNPIELKDYINKPMSSIQSVVKGMSDTGFKEGNNYSDGAVTAFAGFDNDSVDSISIFEECSSFCRLPFHTRRYGR